MTGIGEERLSPRYHQASLTCRGQRTQTWEEQSRCLFSCMCDWYPGHSPRLPRSQFGQHPHPPQGCRDTRWPPCCDPGGSVRPALSPNTLSPAAGAHVDTRKGCPPSRSTLGTRAPRMPTPLLTSTPAFPVVQDSAQREESVCLLARLPLTAPSAPLFSQVEGKSCRWLPARPKLSWHMPCPR